MTNSNWKVSDEAIEEVLRQYGQDLTATTAQNSAPILSGVEEDIQEVIASLSRQKMRSICFTGLAGTGKSTMISCVAQYIAAGQNLPESLQGTRVIMIDIDAMNRGAKFMGQFEARLSPLLNGLREREGCLDGHRIILASDDLPSLLNTNSNTGGSGAGNMIKPFLTSKGITLLTSATPDEYRTLIEKDLALGRRFEVWEMLPPGERAKRRAAIHAAKLSEMMEAFTSGAVRPVPVMRPLVFSSRGFVQTGKGLFA